MTSEAPLECPRCRKPLEAGYLLDQTRVVFKQLRWVAGPPEEGWFGVRARGKDVFRVFADRCPSCGHLELRAVGREIL